MINKDMLLVVDDIQMNRLMLSDMFEEKFEVLEAENGLVAVELLERYGDRISLVLLDLVMPVMDGFEVLKIMNENGMITTIPVIMITGESNDDNTLTGYGLGVSDLVTKPFNPDIVYRRVDNVVALYDHRREMERKLQEQREMLETQASRLKQSNQFLIDALSTTVEFRNLESGEHIKRIRGVTSILLHAVKDKYPITNEDIEIIANASAVHDIGKIAVPDKILLKPGPLTKEEFEVMKSHTTSGCEILSSLDYMQDEKYYTYCYEICRHHHERWDGRGYPDGLKGEEISIWAQATSLADVYDALTSKRIYKDAYTHQEAVDMILRGECGVFNPILIEKFLEVQNEVHAHLLAITSASKSEENLLARHLSS